MPPPSSCLVQDRGVYFRNINWTWHSVWKGRDDNLHLRSVKMNIQENILNCICHLRCDLSFYWSFLLHSHGIQSLKHTHTWQTWFIENSLNHSHVIEFSTLLFSLSPHYLFHISFEPVIKQQQKKMSPFANIFINHPLFGVFHGSHYISGCTYFPSGDTMTPVVAVAHARWLVAIHQITRHSVASEDISDAY